MTDKELLKKAIEIAIENGMPLKTIDKGTFYQLYILVNGRGGKKLVKHYFNLEDCYGLIFSHDFAKAFWGESENKIKTTNNYSVYDGNRVEIHCKDVFVWQYHLQQMVLCENPIDYLRNFIENKD